LLWKRETKELDFGRLSNKGTAKRLVSWSVGQFFHGYYSSLYAGDRICKRFRLHERINPTDIFGNNQRTFYFCVIIKNNAL
jgi:hypothetical protein